MFSVLGEPVPIGSIVTIQRTSDIGTFASKSTGHAIGEETNEPRRPGNGKKEPWQQWYPEGPSHPKEENVQVGTGAQVEVAPRKQPIDVRRDFGNSIVLEQFGNVGP